MAFGDRALVECPRLEQVKQRVGAGTCVMHGLEQGLRCERGAGQCASSVPLRLTLPGTGEGRPKAGVGAGCGAGARYLVPVVVVAGSRSPGHVDRLRVVFQTWSPHQTSLW